MLHTDRIDGGRQPTYGPGHVIGRGCTPTLLLLLLFFFRLESTYSLRLWCFTHHATNFFGTSIMAGFVYLLLAYLYATSLLIFFFFFISPFCFPVSSFILEFKKFKIRF